LPKPWTGMMSEGWGALGRIELARLCDQRGIELEWYEGERRNKGERRERWEGYLEDLV
jgi:hypothetical protein